MPASNSERPKGTGSTSIGVVTSVDALGAPPPDTVAEFGFNVSTPASTDTVIVTTIVAPASTAPCEGSSSYVHVTGAIAHVILYFGSPFPFAASPLAETLVAVTPVGNVSVSVTTLPCVVGSAPSLRTIST